MSALAAIVPIRAGILPVGADEVIAEAGGACWLVGTGCRDAVVSIGACLERLMCVEVSVDGPARLATILAGLVTSGGGAEHLLLPMSPDGRDLAPHLAAALGRPLVAGATIIGEHRAVVARQGGLVMETLALDGPVVATFQPGVREVPQADEHRPPTIIEMDVPDSLAAIGPNRVELLEVLPADPATMDLSEAPRIVAGGAGLGDSDTFDALHAISAMLGASVGATRVVTDQGWISADRQIGTTGVTVDPELYLAVGISGAVQHTAGLGTPDHVIVVNTDAACPMMELADLAIVCDGPAFLTELTSALDGFSRTPSNP